MNNAELIKALRYCAEHEGCDYYIAKDCPREDTWACGVDCEQILMLDVADALEAADKRIKELEAQIPKDGEWITTRTENHDGEIYCSVCDYDAPTEGDYRQVKTNYCPNCGARMRGEHDEQIH